MQSFIKIKPSRKFPNLQFVIGLLESIVDKPAACKVLTFSLVSVAEQAGLNLTLSKPPKTCFLALGPILYSKTFLSNHSKRRPKIGPIIA